MLCPSNYCHVVDPSHGILFLKLLYFEECSLVQDPRVILLIPALPPSFTPPPR